MTFGDTGVAANVHRLDGRWQRSLRMVSSDAPADAATVGLSGARRESDYCLRLRFGLSVLRRRRSIIVCAAASWYSRLTIRTAASIRMP